MNKNNDDNNYDDEGQSKFNFEPWSKAARGRDEGMDRVEKNSGQKFQDAAYEFLPAYLKRIGQPLSSEDLTDACKNAGIKPHNDKAFGPVILRLMRNKKIVRVGYGRRRKAHLSYGCAIYRAL